MGRRVSATSQNAVTRVRYSEEPFGLIEPHVASCCDGPDDIFVL